MDMEQMKYVMELPEVLMDSSITEYEGYNPETGRSEIVIQKKDRDLFVQASVYGLLEQNELMDDLLDYFAENKLYDRMIVFDDKNQSVIRLDY